MFCSSPSHYIRTCPDAAWYLRQGKIICNHAGKLSLPNGRYPPHVTPGKNLRERIDNYRDPYQEDYYPHSREDRNHDSASCHYLEIVDEPTSDNGSLWSDDSRSSPTLSADTLRQLQTMVDLFYERIQELKQSARVESLTRPGSPFHTQNSVPTSFPRSQIHDNVTRSPSPWTPRTPPRSASFKPRKENRFNDHLTYTPYPRPRRPMIPITGFRYSRPTITDPDSPEMSRTTADYQNASPTIADYHGNSWTAMDYPDASRNVAESCYWPAIETSIKNAPEHSNFDAGIAILDREHLPASPDVQSEVSDSAPTSSEPSPRIEDPGDSGFSAFPEFDEAEEIIDFYLSFESDPPSDHDNAKRSDPPLSEPLIFRNQKPAHLDTPDQREEPPLSHHPSPCPIPRSPSSFSSTSYYSLSSRSPLSSTSYANHRDVSSSTSAHSALSDTSLDGLYEFDDSINACADSRAKDDSLPSLYHPGTSLFRSLEPQSAVHASHSLSVSPPARAPPSQSPLENSRLDNSYEYSDWLDAYADSDAENNLIFSSDEASPSPDPDRFRHPLASPTEIAISATVPRTSKFSSTAKSRVLTIGSPHYSLSSIPRHSAMFSTPLRSRL